MASLPPDPWKALGVDKTADKAEIRTAYKKLVLKCHPDKVQDPALKAQKQEEFQKVQQAYELLNDDAERAKYEEQLKYQEIRRQAAMMQQPKSNSSASRTPTKAYEIRTAEKYRSSPLGGGKVYTHPSAHSRSHEDVPSRYPEVIEKFARRTSSYEKSFRDEDRRERERDRERRSRREPDDDYRIREQQRIVSEKEKEYKEKERRRNEKERDRDRKRGQEEKRRFTPPYIEEPGESEDQQPAYVSKTEKKRSSSKKPYEAPRERERERERSTASRLPASPVIETVQPPAAPAAPPPETKMFDDIDKAATYIERSRRHPRGVQEQIYPVAPTPPPPVEVDDDIAPRPRVAGRRASHDASRSREKLTPSHRPPPPFVVEASPKSSSHRVPGLHKSHTTPLSPEPSSPPRIGVNRSNTAQEYSTSVPQAPPGFSRSRTWAAQDYPPEYYQEDSDDDHHGRRHRRSRRRSPEPQVRSYKVGSDLKTKEYGYGASPNSTRYMPSEAYDSHAPNGSYPPYIKVKEARAYGPADVKYSDTRYNVAYTPAPGDYSSVYA